jgi:allophanate hydrolase
MNRTTQLAVVGAHLSGMPLNHELTRRDAVLLGTFRTSSEYALFLLNETTPLKPGLCRRPGYQGCGIEVEIWKLSIESFGDFVVNVPPPMTIGTITLSDETKVKGFLVEPYALEGCRNITEYGGWRTFLLSFS